MIDVVIVAWNTREYLGPCLESLARVSESDRVELGTVTVVDNGSTDGGVASLTHFGLPLEIIKNAGNEGFAAAVNQGARAGSSSFLLLLNPDVVLREGSLRVPLEFMVKAGAAKVGICGVKNLAEDGSVQRSCTRCPTPTMFWQDILGLSVLAPTKFGSRMIDWDHLASRQVGHVIGAFYLIRRELFAALGGLDERFFVYLEDLDFSCRAQSSGWSVQYLADAAIVHASGGASRQIKPQRLAMSLMARCRYALKHFSKFQAVSIIAGLVAIEPFVRVGGALLAGSSARAGETIAAYAILLRWSYRKAIGHPDSRRPPM